MVLSFSVTMVSSSCPTNNWTWYSPLGSASSYLTLNFTWPSGKSFYTHIHTSYSYVLCHFHSLGLCETHIIDPMASRRDERHVWLCLLCAGLDMLTTEAECWYAEKCYCVLFCFLAMNKCLPSTVSIEAGGLLLQDSRVLLNTKMHAAVMPL